MSAGGARIRHRPIAPGAPAEQRGAAEPQFQPSPGSTPYWLLWPAGIAAAVLCVAAFLLWGFGGAATLFDMIVALCS